jgi:hypothetical protein
MNEETFLPTPPSGTSTSRQKGSTSAFHHQQQGSTTSSSSPATMMALTSLSRDQLVEVVRAHERHPRGSSSSSRNDQPQLQLQHQQPIILPDFSFTSPRVPKKAKHSTSSTAADDDLEGFLAKGKAELGVAGANSGGGGATTDDDDDVLIVRPTTKPTASTSSASSVASRTASWQRQRGTSHSRSFRSFASGSTAAELDCLVSVATPPGLLRMYSSTRSLTTPGCTTTSASGGTAAVRVVVARLSRPRHPCVVEQRLRSITVTEEHDTNTNNNSHSSSSNSMDETTDDTGVAR